MTANTPSHTDRDGATADAIVEVRNLVKHFPLRRGLRFWRPPAVVRAVEDVSFQLQRGRTYGLVGESGSGKSTIARVILGLEPATAGDVLFEGAPIDRLRRAERKHYRANVQAVFQDPRTSLNPRMRVSEIVGEPTMLHQGLGRKARAERVAELLEVVGLSSTYAARFPHEFSGGQQQRIAIARAIATTPSLIVLDEPVSSLDVSIRAQVLNLLAELQEQFGLTYLLIAHDLAAVQRVSDIVGVLYLGKLMEECPSEDLTARPRHPYTQALLNAAPIPDPTRRRRHEPIQGEIGSSLNPPPGCRFSGRCPVAFDRCSIDEPPLITVSDSHRVACHLIRPGDEKLVDHWAREG